MASAGTFCDETDVALRAGANMSSDIDSGDTDETDKWIVDAESFINVICGYNFTDAFAGLNADVKYILRECAASMAANTAVAYDMSGYSSRVEAETILDVNRDRYMKCLEILQMKVKQDFITGA